MEFVQVVSVENMRKSDARTIAEHTPSAELMYRAAQGIFNSAKFVGRVAIVAVRATTAATVMRSPVFYAKTALHRQFSEQATAFQRTAFIIIKPQCHSVPRRCRCHRRRLSRDLTL